MSKFLIESLIIFIFIQVLYIPISAWSLLPQDTKRPLAWSSCQFHNTYKRIWIILVNPLSLDILKQAWPTKTSHYYKFYLQYIRNSKYFYFVNAIKFVVGRNTVLRYDDELATDNDYEENRVLSKRGVHCFKLRSGRIIC